MAKHKRNGKGLSSSTDTGRGGPPAVPPRATLLDRKREALRKRLDHLLPAAKASNGFKSASALLGASYVRADLAARVALLEAADFLIRVLEMMPPA